ncbi:restriction endonuclease subunit S [Primorskyibacter marinus]|uniref:restriction endonuclease subunit S n=1 Tax=Primorskyibacter marinus TaxID=1977320 RepID=UPI000E30B18A|nr:restriction endonuclease subunit S [Primorskyibacter marinus]
MNAERLLEVYEQISEAPDAIARLRRFVLDLAVRGKLVEQDARDEPATTLMKAAKSLQAKEGIKIKADLLQPSEAPFQAPLGWLWTRVGLIALQTGSGSTPRGGKSAYTDEGTPFLRSQNIYDDGLRLDDVVFINHETNEKMKRTQVKAKDLLLNITGGSIGRCTRVPDEFAGANVSQHVAIIRTAASGTEDYLHLLTRSPFFQGYVVGEQTGAGRGGLPKNRMDRIPVPLPPLAEQHRIVAKVDELMALCDRLEEARKTREEVRDKLTAASLARLTAPDTTAEDFPTHAAFALEALPALTTRPDQIKTLRQTILDLAVRGKLVKQDAADGTGIELMTTIASSLDRLTFTRADSSLVDFAVPEGWDLQSLDAITADGPKNGLSPTKTENPSAPKAITLTATTSGQFDRRHFKRVDVSLSAAEPFWLQPDDLLFQRGNTPEYVGIAAIYDGPEREFLYPDLIMRVRIASAMSLRFVHLWCISPVARGYLMANATGAQKTMPKINQGVLKALPIMIPPLAEQHRIVAKVDALMALCDRLEAALTTTDTIRTRLLEALLHEALEPTPNALEAAE